MERREFIQACAQGGRALEGAFRRVMRDFWGPLLRDAVATLGQVEAASDLVQETLIRGWRRCSHFRGDSELLGWLRGILRHALIDRLRASRPELPLMDDELVVLHEVEQTLQALPGAGLSDPVELAARAELQRLYETCFARFSAAHPLSAAVVRWVAEEGMELDELARLLGRTPGATREFVSQSRKKARVYLAEWYAVARGAQELVE